MEECNHDCNHCSQDCDSAKGGFEKEALHPQSKVAKVIGVVSGKGGVGKSLVTALLSVLLQRNGYQTAVLDADVTGPSIPKAFGLSERARASKEGMYPVCTRSGIKVMSVNLLLENENDPVVWRGPVIAGAVKQFWTDVIWGDVDYMLVDMPPGTGDVPLTIYQSLPVDGIVVVTSPQDLVSMVVTKAVKMAEMLNIPILGLIENYSYFECPDCHTRVEIFGQSKLEQVAASLGLDLLGKIPIQPELAASCDRGALETFQGNFLDHACEAIQESCPVNAE